MLEGLPAVLFGVTTLVYLKDHPKDATWLRSEERTWLESELQQEKQQKHGKMTAWRALKEKNVLILAAALFVSNIGSSAFFMWLPETVRRVSGLSVDDASWFTAIPFLVGTFALMIVSASSDRTGKRKLHASVSMLICGVSFGATVLFQHNFPWLMVCLSLAASGLFGSTTSFWVLPTSTLKESAAAAAVGLINSVGNLGGFFGPTLVGIILTREQSFPAAVLWTAGCLFTTGILVLAVRERPTRMN
jgi:predicted MFS family arabinose efflux permease